MAAPGSGEIVEVRAKPRGRRNAVVGMYGSALKVEVTVPPEDGRANAAVADVLAGFFGVRRDQVEMVSGQTSRAKRFRIAGVTRHAIVSRTAALVQGGRP